MARKGAGSATRYGPEDFADVYRFMRFAAGFRDRSAAGYAALTLDELNPALTRDSA